MEFKENKPIFLQIADHISTRIQKGELKPDSRIPSVRETAAEFEVNPNTVVRSYNSLQDQGIIWNKRGIGYFPTDSAAEKITESMKSRFLEKELPHLFSNMELLGISSETIIEYYEAYRRNKA